MGVRGFTTFISKQKHLFYETYQLKNCYVVIDGNGIAIKLYFQHTNSNDCCGGDYDQYAKTVNKFFSLLKECNVTPIIIFDGCLEDRKMDTIFHRMRSRLCSLENLGEAFPLFTTRLFEDIALSLAVKCIRTEHESDSEIACLGKYLNCPILGNDSDFYFFDTLYIPFDTFKMKSVRRCDLKSRTFEQYIPCEVYKINNFLNHFEGLDKHSLPVLLGNDYVDRSLFAALYEHTKVDKSRFEKEPKIAIATVIKWLQHETLESAISKILGCFNADRRKSILIKLKRAMKGYLQINSTVTEYLVDMGIPICKADKYDFDILSIAPTFEDDNDSGSSYCEWFEVRSETSESEISELSENVDKEDDLFFNMKYRTCLFPASFGDIKWKNRYFCLSLVENHEDPDSQRISFDILVSIHKILNPSTETPLTCFFRIADTTLGSETQARHDNDLPDLQHIQKLQKKDCKLLLLKILKIDTTYQDFLDMFPSDWHLFLISLYYWKSKSKKVIDSLYIYSLIICAIVLNFIDTKIGFLCRSQSVFEQTLKDRIPWRSTVYKPSKTIQGSFDNITYDEGLLCLKTILRFFYTWPKNNFDERLNLESIVGFFSEFQSCSLHIKYLNATLGLPFENLMFSKFFSGTFLYNTIVDFRKESNLKSYLETLFKDCKGVLFSVELIMKNLEHYFDKIHKFHAKKPMDEKDEDY